MKLLNKASILFFLTIIPIIIGSYFVFVIAILKINVSHIDQNLTEEKLHFEKQLNKILQEKTQMCAAGFKYSNSGNVYLPPVINDNAIELFLRNKLYGSTQSWMYSKKIIIDINGYDKDLVCSQDLDLTFRALTKFPKISIISGYILEASSGTLKLLRLSNVFHASGGF